MDFVSSPVCDNLKTHFDAALAAGDTERAKALLEEMKMHGCVSSTEELPAQG